MKRKAEGGSAGRDLPKAPSGIKGLDEITHGGLPQGRTTLICGSAGCGKTLLAAEFLVRGALNYGENGVFVAFEENEEELATNAASLSLDLRGLIRRNKIVVDFIRIEPSELEETGEYNLEGLFIRLSQAIESVGAKRVVLDTVDILFSTFSNHWLLRGELGRLFRWLKEKEVTAIVTAERGDGSLTRNGLEEYVADCVILLDHRVTEQVPTRRLRIIKYRGSPHGTNEYPFMISQHGFSVLPITSTRLDYLVSDRRIPTGVPGLDAMLGGRGYFAGGSILVTGSAGTGKTSLAAAFGAATCHRGARCLYLAFEESPSQIIRNLRSIGIDLEAWVRRGSLQFQAGRPAAQDLESHLVAIYQAVDDFQPEVVIMDPITNLVAAGTTGEVKSVLTRLLDSLKARQITVLCTSLTAGGEDQHTDGGVSSLMDTWLLVRNLESGGERNRVLYVLKSRGMTHSNQVREFVLSNKGIDLVNAYTGSGAVLTGTARVVQRARERAEEIAEREQNKRERMMVEAEIAALKAQLKAGESRLAKLTTSSARRARKDAQDHAAIYRQRMSGTSDSLSHRRAKPKEMPHAN